MCSTTCPLHGKVLVCPQCEAIARGRKGGLKGKPFRYKDKAPTKSKVEADPAEYTAADCLSTFQAAPNSVLSPKQVLAAAAAKKQAQAARAVYRRLDYLVAKGKIERLKAGEYRLLQAK